MKCCSEYGSENSGKGTIYSIFKILASIWFWASDRSQWHIYRDILTLKSLSFSLCSRNLIVNDHVRYPAWHVVWQTERDRGLLHVKMQLSPLRHGMLYTACQQHICGSLTTQGRGCYYIRNMSLSHLKMKSRVILYVHDSVQYVLKFCKGRGSDTGMLCAKCQKDYKKCHRLAIFCKIWF